MPKISVIIALTTKENISNLCFESLTQQTFDDFECLCVQQNTLEEYPAIMELIKKDSRFKLLKTPSSNPSKWDCYNEALYQIKGEYVLFLNDTDLLHLQALDIFSDALRYSHAQIASAERTIFSSSKKLKAQKQKIPFDKSILKKRNQNFLTDFWQGNPFQINGFLEGKIFTAELISYLKFHTNLREFSPYFFMEQAYSLIKHCVYIKYPLCFLRKEAHIPALYSFETLKDLKERITFEYAYFIEVGRISGYSSLVLRRKCSQDVFNAIKHVVLHTPESTFICINQQLINLVLEIKNYGLLQGLSLSFYQKTIIFLLIRNKLSLVKKILRLFS